MAVRLINLNGDYHGCQSGCNTKYVRNIVCLNLVLRNFYHFIYIISACWKSLITQSVSTQCQIIIVFLFFSNFFLQGLFKVIYLTVSYVSCLFTGYLQRPVRHIQRLLQNIFSIFKGIKLTFILFKIFNFNYFLSLVFLYGIICPFNIIPCHFSTNDGDSSHSLKPVQ